MSHYNYSDWFTLQTKVKSDHNSPNICSIQATANVETPWKGTLQLSHQQQPATQEATSLFSSSPKLHVGYVSVFPIPVP